FTDKDNIPIGQVTTRGLLTGRATLQFATSTTPEAHVGDVFKWIDPDRTNTEVYYFYIDSVERTERKGEESKQPVTFRRVLKPTAFEVTDAAGAKTVINLTTLTWT